MNLKNARKEDLQFQLLDREGFQRWKPQMIQWDQDLLVPSWSEQQWAIEDQLNKNYWLGLSLLDKEPVSFSLVLMAGDQAHLLKIATLIPWRSQGLAQQHFEEMKSRLKISGFQEIFLEVALSNFAAKSFYEKNFFEALRVIKDLYGPGCDGQTMISKI